MAKFNMQKFALKIFQIPPKREVHIFNMYLITLQSLKAVAFILFEFRITQTLRPLRIEMAKFNMQKFALNFFQIPPKREVHIFNMYIITLQSLKAVAFILFKFQITQTFCDGQTDGRTNSRAATRPAVTVGDAGKKQATQM